MKPASLKTSEGRKLKIAGYDALAKQHEANAKELEKQAAALAKSDQPEDARESRRLLALAKSERGAADYRRKKIETIKGQE